MKRMDMRILLVVVAGLTTLMLAVGCTTRPEASESLVMQGNHSQGSLRMVTADTSSDGYHYLEPDLSPDGTRIVFSADWAAVPPPGHIPDVIPIIRQIAVVPVSEQTEPLMSVAEAGAHLVHHRPFPYLFGGQQSTIFPHEQMQKGQPIWIDDDNVLFWIKTPRGARLFRCYVPAGTTAEDLLEPQVVVREPSDDDEFPTMRFWEHYSPSLSPDGQWLAFSRYGYQNVDSLDTVTEQSIWVAHMPEEGEVSDVMFQVTSGASQVDAPSWSPDGSTLVFHAGIDLMSDDAEYFTKEIFTVSFDTTGLAENGVVELDRDLNRLTYSPRQEGSPIAVRNASPVFSPDGSRIIFVSDRRVPTLTFTDRNIWWIPADGSLEPQLVFFTRDDDVDPLFTGNADNEVLLSSGLGFPTSMLDRLYDEAVQRYLETPLNLEDVNEHGVDPVYPTQVQAESMASADREELSFFEGVMSHIYLLTDW